MVKIFIGGFPLDASELELVQLVSPYGMVSTIKIIRDRKTRTCKGYAFLEMPDRAEAEQAVEALNGRPSGDRMLKLNICEEEQGEITTAVPANVAPALQADRPKRPRRMSQP
jgi:RNA recognition motif-containing protein